MVLFNLPLKNRNVTGDFHRPYGRKNRIGVVNFVGAATSRPHPSVLASTRLNGKMFNMVPFNLPLKNRNVAGDFHRPYETLNFLTAKKISRFLTQERYRVGKGTYRIGTILKRHQKRRKGT